MTPVPSRVDDVTTIEQLLALPVRGLAGPRLEAPHLPAGRRGAWFTEVLGPA